MVGPSAKYPFFDSFLAGVLSVGFVGVLTFISIFSWRYYRGRRRTESSNSALALNTLEDGIKASDVSDISSRSPSRLGGISPSPPARVDKSPGTQSQFSAPSGMADDAQDDVLRPVSGVSQSSAYIANSLTTEGAERVEDHTNPSGAFRPRPSVFPSQAKVTRPVPTTSTGRLSVSTVWSQESMWPREKRPVPDVPVPVPPLAYMPAPRRMIFPPIVISNSRDRRSMSSLPRSVGASDFEDYM